MNMREILNLRETKGDIGLEIEVEGRNLPMDLEGVWRIEGDGSLKSGQEAIEYVMPYPQSLQKVRDNLDILKNAYKINKSEILDSVYAGVHCHINVQELTPKQVYTFITCYYMLEDLLVEFCGPTRQGNHFCLRVQDAEFSSILVGQAASKGDITQLNRDTIRYGALNISSLFKYGSLEFRAMRSTEDFDILYDWSDILLTIKENSMRFDNPEDVLNSMSGQGEIEFINLLLGRHAKMFLKYKDVVQRLRDATRNIQHIAYATDWSKYFDQNNNPFKKGYFRHG